MTKDKNKNKKISAEDREYIEKMLRDYPRRESVLRKLDLDIEEIKLEDGMSAVCYDGDNVQTSNISDTVAKLAIKREKEIKKILKEKNRKNIHFGKIEIALEEFQDLDCKLIEYRYFKGYSWGMIENRIGYSDSRCKHRTYDCLNVLAIKYKILAPKEEEN